ncbi:hypothetical protein DFP88_102904 [Pseudoroseicyclus aestuarii]|uniref:Uncharacterized protein n=2 Tax=Pseudoroseicyclus aestuarii TaxID=1795041 RepID=A0A318T9V1_9RHOB|nr:hypothetical protein DFP88_102904 [Pseudoroseicyclus aestuarii]
MPLTGIYAGVVAAGLLQLAWVWRRWPRDDEAPWQEVKSGLPFTAALSEILAPSVLLRVLLVGAINSGAAVSGAVLGLILTQAGRPDADLGLFFGGSVGLEVVVMMSVGAFTPYLRRLHLVGIGALFYAAYLALLPLAAPSAWLWALVPLQAIGGGLIFALSIAYLQDLLALRAGAGAALLSVERAGAEGMAAGLFGLGTAMAGYGLVAALGAALVVTGMGWLLGLDRRRDKRQSKNPGPA